MALPTGKDAAFTFDGTVYDSDDCLQDWALNDAINEVIYTCGGQDRAAVGSRTSTFQVTLALDTTDDTKVSALAPGSTGTFEAHPAGDTATYIEITSTDAVITNAGISTAVNDIITMDVTIRLNDITIGAAT